MLNRHHVLFNKREWESRPQYKELRCDSGLIIPMDSEVHRELHKEVPLVPLLGYYGVMAVEREFSKGRDYLGTVDNLMSALDKTSHNERLSRIERSLSSLALESVEMQRPFIEDGLIR